MFFPVRTDVGDRSRPWMNWLLILANVAISVWAWKNAGLAEPFELNTREPHLLNFVSYSFLHQMGGRVPWLSIHLMGNVLALFVFGANVNQRLGHVGYLALYLCGAVLAGVGCVVFPPESSPRVIGASGAVMGVVGAYLVFYPRSNVIFVYMLGIANGLIEVPCVYLISFFAALDVAMSLAGSGGVAHMAHVWGAVLGIALAIGLLSLRLVPRDPFDFLALVQRWNRRREYQRLVAAGYDPFTPAPPEPAERVAQADPEPDPNLEKIKELRARVHEALAHHNLPHAAIVYLELKGLDPDQVLSRQAQLDVANQLASQQFYVQAADAYEQFLRHYPNYGQIEHVELMLGLICTRYLDQPQRARELLEHAAGRLHGENELRLAKAELDKLRES